MRRNRRRRRERRGSATPDMAPLLDMIFILLIFFVVNANFVRETGVSVDRAAARTAASVAKVKLVIAITATGDLFMEGSGVDIGVLRNRMERFALENPDASVVIAADRAAASGRVIRVLDLCRLAGVSRLSLAARRPE